MRKITAKTKLCAVFGDPISHSLSPVVHNGWMDDLGIDAAYVGLRLSGDDPEAALRALPALGFVGANITVPHKEAALRAASWVDPSAARIGAVNALRITQSGGLEAFNTDAPGLIAALDEADSCWRTRGPVVLIGAGGAAKAALIAISDSTDAEIRVLNRTYEKAHGLAALARAGVRAVPFEEMQKALEGAGLVVNASAMGFTGANPLVLPPARCADGALAMDAVYAPLDTAFLQSARGQGLHTADGLGMLLYQAALAFELWFGVRPDVARGKERLLAALAARGK